MAHKHPDRYKKDYEDKVAQFKKHKAAADAKGIGWVPGGNNIIKKDIKEVDRMISDAATSVYSAVEKQA